MKHFSMIRSFHLADLFTLGNAFCGMGALFAVMHFLRTGAEAHLFYAVLLVPAAGVFDLLDGRIARWRHAHSELGRELDSLADILSFGVAPAAIAYGAGMHGLWDQAVLIAFVGCGVSRLARFNITADALSGGGDKVRYFEGTPIPTSIVLVVLLGFAVHQGRIGPALYGGAWRVGPGELHPLVLLFALSGSLMISKTLRIPKF